MKKSPINRRTILDKLHRGTVYACVGVTLCGTLLLGLRAYRYFAIVKPERQRLELKKIENDPTIDSFDKAPELKC